MRKSEIIFIAMIALLMCVQSAEAQDKVEVFGGYSFDRAPVAGEGPLTPCVMGVCPPEVVFSARSANGWEITGTYNANKWLGVSADFGGFYTPTFFGNFHLQTYLFGPQVRLPGRFSPFAHALVGVASQAGGATSATTFSSAIGGGVDLRLNHFVSVRLVQLDALITRFGGVTQTEPRVSAGVVLHF
jgi:hypothetical protein